MDSRWGIRVVTLVSCEEATTDLLMAVPEVIDGTFLFRVGLRVQVQPSLVSEGADMGGEA